ncbi:hypothetical protein [Methylosinus sp. Sm6]|uniref:hypothetical protein n=1 Tax=Methylosinus sp. Sm6 TaxID=2866948 RepID=UPI001C99CA1A|nr:hypothetical protein [Methylosinus sp. Sm6]MBY6241967.1 hypothetical protein [Methylosinus sp. Sm6]
MKAFRNALTAAVSLAPTAALAHPGAHPADLGWDLVHIFTQPDHLVAMALGLVWVGMTFAVCCWFKPWRADSWR